MGGDNEEHFLVACDGMQCGGMLSTFREKVMSSYTFILSFLETAVNFYHLLWLYIAEGGRQLAHYSVCGLRKVDQNYLECFEMWSWRR